MFDECCLSRYYFSFILLEFIISSTSEGKINRSPTGLPPLEIWFYYLQIKHKFNEETRLYKNICHKQLHFEAGVHITAARELTCLQQTKKLSRNRFKGTKDKHRTLLIYFIFEIPLTKHKYTLRWVPKIDNVRTPAERFENRHFQFFF